MLFGIREAVEQFLLHYCNMIPLLSSSDPGKVQFGVSYWSFKSLVEAFIKKLFQMTCNNYKYHLELLINELANSFFSSKNGFKRLSDLMEKLQQFSSRLFVSMNTLQTLMVGSGQSMFGNQTVGNWLFIQLFPHREFCERELCDLVLDIESPMPKIYNHNASEHQLLLTFLSDQRKEDEQQYKGIYELYLSRYLSAKNGQLYKQIVEYKQMLQWIMMQWGKDIRMYNQLESVLRYKEENLIGLKLFGSAMHDILTQLQQRRLQQLQRQQLQRLQDQLQQQQRLRNQQQLRQQQLQRLQQQLLQQRKNMLMGYFNGIFNFKITNIPSFIIKERDDLVSFTICDCRWQKMNERGNTKIWVQEDKRDHDGIIDLKSIKYLYRRIPENIFLSLVKYKILGCQYPVFYTDKPLFDESLINPKESGLYVYIQLPLIEEMIQCKKMLDSGLLDQQTLESEAGREWLEILSNMEIIQNIK